MSQHGPTRRITVGLRQRLIAAVFGRDVEQLLRVGLVDVRWHARRLGCRASQLRRCLLGRVVSARAAARILAASEARTRAA